MDHLHGVDQEQALKKGRKSFVLDVDEVASELLELHEATRNGMNGHVVDYDDDIAVEPLEIQPLMDQKSMR